MFATLPISTGHQDATFPGCWFGIGGCHRYAFSLGGWSYVYNQWFQYVMNGHGNLDDTGLNIAGQSSKHLKTMNPLKIFGCFNGNGRVAARPVPKVDRLQPQRQRWQLSKISRFWKTSSWDWILWACEAVSLLEGTCHLGQCTCGKVLDVMFLSRRNRNVW